MSEELFRKVLSIERKRSERSRHRFVLMLVHAGKVLQAEGGEMVLEGITKALSTFTRETDLHGWYQNGLVIGVICTEIGTGDMTSDPECSAFQSELRHAIQSRTGADECDPYLFPCVSRRFGPKNGGRSADISLYPDLLHQNKLSKASRLIKRAMDLSAASSR